MSITDFQVVKKDSSGDRKLSLKNSFHGNREENHLKKLEKLFICDIFYSDFKIFLGDFWVLLSDFWFFWGDFWFKCFLLGFNNLGKVLYNLISITRNVTETRWYVLLRVRGCFNWIIGVKGGSTNIVWVNENSKILSIAVIKSWKE